MEVDQAKPLQFTLRGLQQLEQAFVVVLRLFRNRRSLLPGFTRTQSRGGRSCLGRFIMATSLRLNR